jgi:hypothetical protein
MKFRDRVRFFVYGFMVCLTFGLTLTMMGGCSTVSGFGFVVGVAADLKDVSGGARDCSRQSYGGVHR